MALRMWVKSKHAAELRKQGWYSPYGSQTITRRSGKTEYEFLQAPAGYKGPVACIDAGKVV